MNEKPQAMTYTPTNSWRVFLVELRHAHLNDVVTKGFSTRTDAEAYVLRLLRDNTAAINVRIRVINVAS